MVKPAPARLCWPFSKQWAAVSTQLALIKVPEQPVNVLLANLMSRRPTLANWFWLAKLVYWASDRSCRIVPAIALPQRPAAATNAVTVDVIRF